MKNDYQAEKRRIKELFENIPLEIVGGKENVLEKIEEVKRISQECEFTDDYYRALLIEGRYYQFNNNSTEALQISKRVMNKTRKNIDKTLYIDSLIQVGIIVSNYKSIEEGLKYLNKGLDYIEETCNLSTSINLYKNLGIVFAKKNNNNESYLNLIKALSLAESADDQEQIASIYSWLAHIEYQITNYEACLDYTLRTNALWLQLKNYLGYAYSQNTAGNLYIKLGEYEKALECLMEADSYASNYNNALITADIKNNLGLLYHHLKDTEKALENYRISMTYREISENDDHLATTLNNI